MYLCNQGLYPKHRTLPIFLHPKLPSGALWVGDCSGQCLYPCRTETAGNIISLQLLGHLSQPCGDAKTIGDLVRRQEDHHLTGQAPRRPGACGRKYSSRRQWTQFLDSRLRISGSVALAFLLLQLFESSAFIISA